MPLRVGFEEAEAMLAQMREQEHQAGLKKQQHKAALDQIESLRSPSPVADIFSLYYDRWQLPDYSPSEEAQLLFAIDLKKKRPERGSAEETALVDRAFKHYRSEGFPFPQCDSQQLLEAIGRIKRSASCIVGRDITANVTAHTVATSFHPEIYSVRCRRAKTPVEIFNDDAALRRCILRRVRFGDNLRHHGIRREIITAPGCQSASNFRPVAAKSIIKLLGAKNVLDPCMGWGGRMLGAIGAGVDYIGIDPCTSAIKGNSSLLRHVRRVTRDPLRNIKMIWACAEDLIGKGLFEPDLVFTSPPYFDAEHYSNELTQSYLRYPTIDAWYEYFLGAVINGAHEDLITGGHLVLNINHDMVARTSELAARAGFKLTSTLELLMGARPSRRKANYRREAVVIWRKV